MTPGPQPRASWPSSQLCALAALDEQNAFDNDENKVPFDARDVIGWEQVVRHVGGMSATDFWRLWGRNLKVR